MKRDIPIWKRDISIVEEKCPYEKRHIHIKRDISISKEIYPHRKRHIHIKRDIFI